MGLSDPMNDSLDIISSQPVNKWLGINPTGLSGSWADSIDIISFQIAKTNGQG